MKCNWFFSPRNTYCPVIIPKQPFSVVLVEVIQGSVKLVTTSQVVSRTGQKAFHKKVHLVVQ